jgi:hypothetical protein
MGLAEVESLEGVGGGVNDLTRLWKCVEKSKGPHTQNRRGAHPSDANL